MAEQPPSRALDQAPEPGATPASSAVSFWLKDRDGFLREERDGAPLAFGSPGWWYGGRAWLDEDGYHVWFAHDCTERRVVTMLPWPTYQANEQRETRPSFSCDGCGFHAFPGLTDTITEHPAVAS